MELDAWREISEVAREVDGLVDLTRDVVRRLAAATDRVPGSFAPGPARVAAARELAVEVARARHAVDVAAAIAAGLTEAEQVHRDDAERSPRTWMTRHLGLSTAMANTDRSRARAMGRFPEVAAAVVAGTITPGHLDAICDIIPSRWRGARLDAAIEKVAAIQTQLVESARWNTVDQHRDFCRTVRDRLDTDGPAPKDDHPDSGDGTDSSFGSDSSFGDGAEPALDAAGTEGTEGPAGSEGAERAEPTYEEGSWLGLRRLRNGRWRVEGELTADDGAAWQTQGAERMVRDRNRCNDLGEPVDDRPYEEKFAAATLSLLLDGAAATRPGRVGLYLHVDLDTYAADAPTAQPDLADLFQKGRAHTEAGLDVTDATLYAWLAGDAANVTPIFEKGGTPLSYGRSRRIAPFELRRAIAHRDRTCAFPNCESPFHQNHAHHLDEWDDGGTTDPDNVRGTCVTNHLDDVHARGWTLRPRPDGRTDAVRPDGTTFDPTPRWQQPRSGSPLEPEAGSEPDTTVGAAAATPAPAVAAATAAA